MKTLNELYKKSEVLFAVLWIVAYVVLSMLGDSLSEAVGVAKSVTMAIQAFMAAALWAWISRNNLGEKYGFRAPDYPASRFLFYLPLALIAAASAIGGFDPGLTAASAVCGALSMLCVGFLEEVIFRGLLFRAMAKTDIRSAVIVSSVTFGLGHIVNLLSGKPLVDTLIQIVFAVTVGFILVLIMHRGGSIIPCIVFHAVNNILATLSGPLAVNPQVELAINIAIIVVLGWGYVAWLLKALPKREGA